MDEFAAGAGLLITRTGEMLPQSSDKRLAVFCGLDCHCPFNIKLLREVFSVFAASQRF